MKYGALVFVVNLLPLIFSGVLIVVLIRYFAILIVSRAYHKTRFVFLSVQLFITLVVYCGLEVRWVFFNFEDSPLLDALWALTEAMLLLHIALFIAFKHPTIYWRDKK